MWLRLVPFLNTLLIRLTEATLGFFEFFGKEQLSVTASRGVSLMPQLKTTKPAGPQSTVPYFTCFKGIVCFKCDIYLHPPSGTKFWALDLSGLRFPAKLCFSHQRSTYTMNQDQSSLGATDMIYMLPLNETIQLVCSLCHWSHHPLLYFSLIHNGPPPMSTLVPTWRRHCCSSCTGSLRGTCLTSLYQQLAQWNTNILLRI